MVRVKRVCDGDGILPCRRRAELDPQWVAYMTQELDMGAVELTGPLADPQQVTRAVVGQLGA